MKLIPTKVQFYKWSMIAKVSYIASVITIITSLIQVASMVFPNQTEYSNRLIQEQNKPTIKISRVELQNFHQHIEPYVVVTLENTSHVSAKNINIKMLGENRIFDLPDDLIRKKYMPQNLSIPPNKKAAIPILPLSKYNQLINFEAPEQELIGLRTVVNEENPFILQDKVCGKVKVNFTSCSFNKIQLSTAIQINFESPYKQKFSLNTQFYNIYLDGKVQAI